MSSIGLTDPKTPPEGDSVDIANVWPVGENIMATREQIARAVDSHLVAAADAGKGRRRRGDLAVSADYDPRSKRLRIELESGASVCVR